MKRGKPTPFACRMLETKKNVCREVAAEARVCDFLRESSARRLPHDEVGTMAD